MQAFKRWPVTPKVRRGREQLYYLPDVVQYLLNREEETSLGPVDSARARKLELEAELAELELRTKRGELIEVAEVVRLVGEEYAAVRAKIVGLPSKGATQCVGLPDEEAAQHTLQSLTNEILDELNADAVLSDGVVEVEDPAEEDAGADPQEAAKPDRKPVGRRKAKAKR